MSNYEVCSIVVDSFYRSTEIKPEVSKPPRKKAAASAHSPSSTKSFDIQLANWRMESIVRESESGSEDEFFDCQGKFVGALLNFLQFTHKQDTLYFSLFRSI